MREVTCNQCGWVHAGLNVQEIAEANPVYDQYDYCFNCGGSYKNFRPAVKTDAPDGVTIQGIKDYEIYS
jgi:hypothetical protein